LKGKIEFVIANWYSTINIGEIKNVLENARKFQKLNPVPLLKKKKNVSLT